MDAGHGTPPAPVLAYVGLGANLGDAAGTLQAAAQAIAHTPGMAAVRLSPLYDTSPVACGGPDYVNAVAEVRTRLSAQGLLTVLQAIEQAHGRERPYRHAPRTLDLDLLWYDGRHLDAPNLTVPHPRMHERAFVLRPLMDLAPDLALSQGSLKALLAQCSTQRVEPVHTPCSAQRVQTLRVQHSAQPVPPAPEQPLPTQPLPAQPSATASGTPPTPPGPRIRIVVAHTDQRVIGRAGGMPWHLPADLAHFKRSTLGHPIIMGRKTWLSLGRPLPGRRNLVVSRNPAFVAPGAECHGSLEAALASCSKADTACIIGGEQIFRLALPLADELIATEIHADIEGDTWFPELPADQWLEVERLPQPPESGLAYDFVTYVRRPSSASPPCK